MYHICYFDLLSFDTFFLEKKISAHWLPKKSGWWKFAFSEAHKFSRQIAMFSFFATLFLEDSQLNFISLVPYEKLISNLFFYFFIRHLVIAVSKRKIGHLTSDNHAVWMLDGVSIISLARSDLHLRSVHVLLSISISIVSWFYPFYTDKIISFCQKIWLMLRKRHCPNFI